MAKKSKKLSKKLDKLEKQGDKLRSRAEKKGKELSSRASDKFEELTTDEAEAKGGKGKFVLLLAAIGGGVFALKRKRDQELDEALWEEPRSI